MTPGLSLTSDQGSFLFLCIQNAGGKIDWNAVARDYESVHGQSLSKGAAEKRFLRLKAKMEEMGMAGSKSTSPRKRKAEGNPNSPGKKVKTEIKEEQPAYELGNSILV